MGITVRTLQYYDKQGLLSPSATSEGGRRLYTDKDMVKLHQILSMKYLGFSLEDVKTRLVSLDTPADVANALAEHAAVIRKKIGALSESLKAIDILQGEVLQMQTVDFARYADIVVNLQMKNDMYWVVKHFDDDLLSHIRSHFDDKSGLAMMERIKRLNGEALQMQKSGVPPDSEQGQSFAKEFWDMILEFTGGDMSMLPKLSKLADKIGGDLDGANCFISQALEAYFAKLGINPLEQEETI